MMYVIGSVSSAVLIGISTLIGYNLFNWVFSEYNVFLLSVSYIIWYIIVFLLAFMNASFIRKLVVKDSFAIVIGAVWACMIVAMLIYTWFKQPYVLGSIIVRVIATWFAIGTAVWTVIMVELWDQNTK